MDLGRLLAAPLTRRDFLAAAGLAGGAAACANGSGGRTAAAPPPAPVPSSVAAAPPTTLTQLLGGNRYLTGNYAPVPDELTSTALEVVGALPRELTGRYVRTGPNPTPLPDPSSYHWFLGDGMVHGIELAGGRAVEYRNRWVRTDALGKKTAMAAPPGPPEVSPVGNPANTSVVAHAGRVLALCEVGLPHELTPALGTVGRLDFGGRLSGAMTAHPKVDPATGDMHFFGYSFRAPYLTYHVADATGALVRSEPITLRGPSMVHDFAVTERSAVFFDLPVVFDLEFLKSGHAIPYGWKPDYGARLGVVPLGGTDADVAWFEVEPCYVFHSVNASEEGGRVTLDVVRYDQMFRLDGDGAPPALHRFTLDRATGRASEERRSDRALEFPGVDDRRTGRATRHGYATEVVAASGGADFGGLLKVDLSTGGVEHHDLGAGRQAGEATFVPAADGTGDDEGWLLSVVYDAARNGSDLVVVDASDLRAPPVATVRLPRRVPFGFHGTWLPAG